MKVVILAGGFGTRLSEYTTKIPKPMVKINGKPILIYIMEHYAKYGFTEKLKSPSTQRPSTPNAIALSLLILWLEKLIRLLSLT